MILYLSYFASPKDTIFNMNIYVTGNLCFVSYINIFVLDNYNVMNVLFGVKLEL